MCEEDRDVLLAAWEEDVIEQRKKEVEVSDGDISHGFHLNSACVLPFGSTFCQCFDTVGLPSADSVA